MTKRNDFLRLGENFSNIFLKKFFEIFLLRRKKRRDFVIRTVEGKTVTTKSAF
jgi:hypothetical protein